MKILILNAGSSSLKYQLIDMKVAGLALAILGVLILLDVFPNL